MFSTQIDAPSRPEEPPDPREPPSLDPLPGYLPEPLPGYPLEPLPEWLPDPGAPPEPFCHGGTCGLGSWGSSGSSRHGGVHDGAFGGVHVERGGFHGFHGFCGRG